MGWSAYEIFSVISGVMLVATALVPGLSAGHRFGAVAGGALYIGYGIYVAGQTSGTFVFPAAIFALPFVLAVYLLSAAVHRRRNRARGAVVPSTQDGGR